MDIPPVTTLSEVHVDPTGLGVVGGYALQGDGSERR